MVVPKNKMGDDEVDGVFEYMDMEMITPQSSPPISFKNSWTISERQKIEERRRSNMIRGLQLKVRYEKMKRNRQ